MDIIKTEIFSNQNLNAKINFNLKDITDISELNNLNLLKVLIFKPFQNIKATLGIYFEALKLWIKGAIYYKKPKKPKKFFSKIK